MLSDDILYMTVSELAPQIRRKKIRPVELTESYLARLEKLGPKLGAVAKLTPENAAGVIIEPSVSDPMANPTSAEGTEAPGPLELPPAQWSRLNGQRDGPCSDAEAFE